jgi:hypothetical protein
MALEELAHGIGVGRRQSCSRGADFTPRGTTGKGRATCDECRPRITQRIVAPAR